LHGVCLHFDHLDAIDRTLPCIRDLLRHTHASISLQVKRFDAIFCAFLTDPETREWLREGRMLMDVNSYDVVEFSKHFSRGELWTILTTFKGIRSLECRWVHGRPALSAQDVLSAVAQRQAMGLPACEWIITPEIAWGNPFSSNAKKLH
jgi:hypothetical protein